MGRGCEVITVVVYVMISVLGVVALSLGAWAILDKEGVAQLSRLDSNGEYRTSSRPGFLEVIAYMDIATGLAMLAVSVLAFCSSKRNSKCLMALCAGALVLMVLVQGCVIAFAVIQRDRIQGSLRDGLRSGLRTLYEGFITSDSHFSTAFDKAQVQFDCCGVENATDFQELCEVWADKSSLQVPKACCKLEDGPYLNDRRYEFLNRIDCAQIPNSLNSNIDKACLEDIRNTLELKAKVLLILAIALAVFQCLGFVTTCCMVWRIKEESPKV